MVFAADGTSAVVSHTDSSPGSEVSGSEQATDKSSVKMEVKPGVLYLVSVPIGNLDDFTFRAWHVLEEVDYIACEEVQSARRLLQQRHVKAKLISYRESGRDLSGDKIVQLLKNGAKAAVISGAGTPAVSDPGRDLVLKCHQAGLPVSPIPGASALTAAVSAAGLPLRRLAFEGFLPRHGSECRQFLENLAAEERTMIFFEAPHRVKETLQLMLKSFGNRAAFIGRELTKYFEECLQSNLVELCAKYEKEEPKGEFVIIVEGVQRDELEEELRLNKLVANDLAFLNNLGLSKRDQAAVLVHFRELPKNKAKQAVMEAESGAE
ncbi:MAG: 16S rRNA (cytidine(1402)-2'-O)-methyltransferase [Candidatus Bruticola sp.]